MLFMCYCLLNSQNISIYNGEKRLVTYLLGHIWESCRSCTENKSNNWPMVSAKCDNNLDEVYVKTKSRNPKQSNISKTRTSFLNLKLQIIRLTQGYWSCRPTHQNSYFYSYTFEKTYLAVRFTKRYSCQFIDRKVVGLMPKYYLLPRDASQVSIFFLA